MASIVITPAADIALEFTKTEQSGADKISSQAYTRFQQFILKKMALWKKMLLNLSSIRHFIKL